MSQAGFPPIPFAKKPAAVTVTPALAARAGLDRWAASFKLGTAGYRDQLDPADMHNLDVPFNSLTVAIMLEARAQLAVEEKLGSLHVGGEVRPHTQEFIDLAARIYAAHGIEVRLRPAGRRTTPIWLSSFGVFNEELDGGENFTASHSQSFKGGWKPMDESGGQLLALADRIADRVRCLVGTAQGAGLCIQLAGSDNRLIRRDFDPIEPYVQVLRQVVPESLIEEIPRAGARGFRAALCTEGGSMGATARRVLAELGIEVSRPGAEGPVFLTHEEEDSRFHGIGILDGVDYGVDPGKWQVYKHVGAQDLLREKEADVFFIFDPDGDRFNMVTAAPAALAAAARAAGLEVDPLDDDRCLVFFKPNQIYFMLTAAKLATLHEAGDLERYDWIVATTFPTSRSIGELAQNFRRRHGGRLETFQAPVGFKHFAALVRDLERQLASGERAAAPPQSRTPARTPAPVDPRPPAPTWVRDVTGRKTVFGPHPRLLIMAEESGGGAFGPREPMLSRHGRRQALAAKEKDAMQIGVMALGLAARLHGQGRSFAAYYLDRLDAYSITHRFYERRDVTLYDESLQGGARREAQERGQARKNAALAFFTTLESKEPQEARAELARRLPAGVALPEVARVFHAGDGTLIEFSDQWFELRASGTDAVLRYYMEGRDPERVSGLNSALTQLSLDDLE
jgi:phosphomannomutase